jgi:hypothetical protein
MPDPLEPALSRKIIRNAAWLVAWDEAALSHVYRRDVDLTIEGDTIAAIGPYRPADHGDAVEIDGRGFAILPGFIDIHAHPSSEPMLKGLTDEVGSRQLYMSSLYEYLPLFEADPDGRGAGGTRHLRAVDHRSPTPGPDGAVFRRSRSAAVYPSSRAHAAHTAFPRPAWK